MTDDWVSDRDRKAVRDLTQPGATYRLSEMLPDRQEINRVQRETTQKLSSALIKADLDEYEANALARFVVQKVVDHFERGSK